MTPNSKLGEDADDSPQPDPVDRLDIPKTDSSQAAFELSVASARAMLVSKYGLDAAFVGVPMLARILGCSPTTIWTYIRQGKFFIPHRLIHGSPKVSVCDLAAWYCSTSEKQTPSEAGRWPSDAGGFDEPLEHQSERERPIKPPNEAEIVAEVLASMGIERARGRRARRAPD